MLRHAAIILALMLVCAPMAAIAQDQSTVQVPAEGYEATDSLPVDSPWKFYDVHVEIGFELVFEFKVVGNGTISVCLFPKDFTTYYIAFSTDEQVTGFARTVPADFGFARDYHIQVNSTAGADVEFTASIHTEEASTGNYTLYYALIILGFAALVVLSWKLVVWQDKRERQEKVEKRRRKR